ncbi:MAG: DUF2791 family P-loop domain-containing protein [Desulfobacteraceae bacterium]|nr:DUF2791 family P-loop domain-containing protein [Desulfobacteraceae bacterium]
MAVEISKSYAKKIRSKLMNIAVAPGQYAHFINAGTDDILSVLEREYFKDELVEGISCFKYLEGDYGSGKTQFIHSLAERARTNDIVSSIVDIGQECPFNSQLSIFKAIMASFVAPSVGDSDASEDKGIEILLRTWIINKLRKLGWSSGQDIPDMARRQVEQTFTKAWLGAPDTQMAYALMALGKRIIDMESGAQVSLLDQELIAWVRGDKITSKNLRENYSLHQPARDETAFKRLKTVIEFLRTWLGFKGFFIAFDEGTRTNTFRRGSVKQKQAIENMLTMINDAGGEFGGVMFLYAATPDFRSDVIQKYPALFDRIGSVAFVPGRPITPLITLETINTEKVIREIGEKLLVVFAKAEGIDWDQEVQSQNIETLIQGIKNIEYLEEDAVSPRHFVYPYCRLLEQQKFEEKKLSVEDAEIFVQTHAIPASEDDE